MIVADLHSHTACSHGANSAAEMIAAAVEKKLKVYGISEHSPRPAGYIYPTDYQDELSAQFQDFLQTLHQYKATLSDIDLLIGIELDYIPGEIEFSKKYTSLYPYDYIIGGLHFQGRWGFDYDEWSNLTEEECFVCYEQYYNDLIDMCNSRMVDIIAHPDLIKLYTVDTFHRWLATPKSKELITSFMKRLKANDLIMEVSTAGLRKRCKEFYPGVEIMRIAAETGVKISIASDAHSVDQIAYAFEDAEKYAKSYGFTEYYYVKERKQHRLPF